MQSDDEIVECAKQFKQVMRGVAGTVAIVTTTHEGEPVGMAATSFCSVSMEPPSVLVCVNRSASVLPAISESRRLCLNILQTDSHSVCSYFGGKYTQAERFTFHSWRATEDGLPFLKDAQAVLVCAVAEEVTHGTHTVFIADVESVLHHGGTASDPLIYVNGCYAKAVTLNAV